MYGKKKMSYKDGGTTGPKGGKKKKNISSLIKKRLKEAMKLVRKGPIGPDYNPNVKEPRLNPGGPPETTKGSKKKGAYGMKMKSYKHGGKNNYNGNHQYD
jgi:hypothetical protein